MSDATQPLTVGEFAVGDHVRIGNGKVTYQVVRISTSQVQIKKLGTKNLQARGGWHAPRTLTLVQKAPA